MINETLQKLGLGSKETQIYLTILQQGKISATNIAKITSINRTTVYSVTKELIEKHLIVEDLGTNPSQFIAAPPHSLNQIIDEKEKIYYDQKRLIEKLMFEMQAHTHGSTYSIPKIAFIVEQDIEAYFYKQTPVWNEELNKTDKTWWAFQDHSVVQLYEEWIDWYWKRDDAKNLYFQAITNDSKIESTMKQKQYQRRKIKFWPKGNNITSSTWVIGNYLILVVTNQKPNYLVEIHDTVLANNTRELLKGIWDQI